MIRPAPVVRAVVRQSGACPRGQEDGELGQAGERQPVVAAQLAGGQRQDRVQRVGRDGPAVVARGQQPDGQGAEVRGVLGRSEAAR
jgi:hypothetical protein